MELKPLTIKITSLADRSPGDLRAEVKFQVDGGPKYIIKAIRVDVREPFINHLISTVKELPTESSGEDEKESEPPDKSGPPQAPEAALSAALSAGAQEIGRRAATAVWEWVSK